MRPIRYEVWDDVQCDSGVRLAAVSDWVAPGPTDEHNLDGRAVFRGSILRTSPAFTHLAVENVISVVWDGTTNTGSQVGFDEYRIQTITDDFTNDDVVHIEAHGIAFDLDRGGFLIRTEANGYSRTDFEVLGRPVDEQVGIVLGTVATAYTSGVVSYFAAGTIDRNTEKITMAFQNDTGYTALKEIAMLHGAELSVRRNGTTNYLVDLLDVTASTAAVVPFILGRGLGQFQHADSSAEQATRIIAQGGGVPPDQATIAGNAFEVLSVSSNDLTMVEDCVMENAQLDGMGLYIEEPDGTLTAVTDSTTPNVITAAGHGVSATEVVRLRANAAGDDLLQMWSPAAETALGGRSIARLLARGDIPNINNEIPESFMDGTYAAGVSSGWTNVGSGTPTENTDNTYVSSGTASQKYVGTTGQGVKRTGISVAPKDFHPFFTPQIKVYIDGGAVEMFLEDETNSVTYPVDVSDDRAVTQGDGWHDLGFRHGVDHVNGAEVTTTTASFALHVLCAEPGTTFYLDAAMLTNTEGGAANYFDGRASNLLVRAANDELTIRKDSLSTYTASVYDLNRKDVTRWPDEPIIVGGDSAVTVEGTTIDQVTARVLSRIRVLEDPLDTRVTLETELARLTRLMTLRRRRDVRRQRGDHTKQPKCGLNLTATLLGADLIVEWDRTNWARVRIKDVTGLTGSAKVIWDAGIELAVDDGTKWELLEGETTSAGATPGQIKTVMAEPYNRFGVGGGCYETSDATTIIGLFDCSFPNLLPDAAAGQTHCTADCVPTCTPSIPAVGTPPIVLYTFSPLLASAAPAITPGVTTLSLCHEGSSDGSGAALPQGFGSWLTFQVTSGWVYHVYGVYDQSTQEWQRARTAFSADGNSQQTTCCSIMQESGQIRQYHGHAKSSPAGTPDFTENRLTSLHLGQLFRPGVAISIESGGAGAESRIYYSNGYLGSELTMAGLTNEKIRLDRDTAENQWMAATGWTSSAVTGTATFDERTVNNVGGGMWSRVAVWSAADAVLATFNGSDHPSGRCWTSDQYTYDSGAGLVVGVGGVIAVNPASTIGLISNGFLYEENWTNKLSATIDAGKYMNSGFTLVPSGYLSASGTGNYLMRIDVGEYDEVCATAVAYRQAGDTAGPPGAAVLYGGIGDVKATLRATFDDGTIVTGTGVSTGDLLTYGAEQVLQDYVWPAAATQLVVEQLHIGADPGEACSRSVMLNTGPQCCTYVDPSNVIVGLPSTDPGCMLNSTIGTLFGVDTCAGGLGVQWFHNIFWNTTQSCVGKDATSGYYFQVLWFEENDPVGQPGVLRHTATFDDPVPIPTGWTVGAPPVHIIYVQGITTEDISQLSPIAGANRGVDGINPQLKQWQAVVHLKNWFLPGNTYGTSTSNTIDAPQAYGWCP